jgi:predicted P-loop ATPase
MLEFALRYAAIGFYIFPLHSIRFDGKCGCGKEDCTSPGKHPRVKWKSGASCDPEIVRGYWERWPNAGIGLACGPSGLLAADADGLGAIGELRALLGGTIPRTALSRTARGGHFFYRSTEGRTRSNPDTKLDTRGQGGFVVLAPSPHVSGHVYRWEVEPWGEGAIADAPAALVAYSQAGRERRGGSEGGNGDGAPPWAATGLAADVEFTSRLAGCLVDWAEVDRALTRIPPDVCMDEWIRVGMALHAAGDSGERWDRWSSRGTKYREGEPAYKWTGFSQKPDGVGLGTLFVIAKEYGYQRGSSLVLPSNFNTVQEDVVKEPEHINGHSHALPATFAEPAIRFPDVTEGGKVKATCANGIAAIDGLGITCEFDEFHERSRVGGQVMSQWVGDLSDNIVHRVRVLIRERYGFDPGNVHTRDALVQACLCRPFHPIKNYLKSLQWDGIPRLETWMPRYLGAADDAFNREVSRLSLIAAVRRILQPGCKFDQIIALDAREGVGKSTAIEILAGRENFSDQAILDCSEERQQEKLQGVWLYEIADLAGHSRAEIEKVKAFASRTTDRARPAYGHFRVDRPRTCILFATTNPTKYLQSPDGNRRFWPVTTGVIDLEGLRRDRDQLWAEALIAERGASLVLNPKLWGEAAERQESRRKIDPWEDALADEEIIKYATKEGDNWQITSVDVFNQVLKIPAAQQYAETYKRIGNAMRRNGWEGPDKISINKIWYKGYTKKYVERGHSDGAKNGKR